MISLALFLLALRLQGLSVQHRSCANRHAPLLPHPGTRGKHQNRLEGGGREKEVGYLCPSIPPYRAEV